MPQTKRNRNNIDHYHDKNKRKKLHDKIITINANKSSFTHFENLSNEIIYEIFDYLDNYQIYQAFFDLNQRFKKLLIHSILPIKINILSMSKSNFQDYYSDIIKSNKHRITSLCLSDLFIKHLFLIILKQNILKIFLKYSFSLPNLYSLIINPIDFVEDSNNLYYQIFRLPVLKYCKISGHTIDNSKLLPNIDNHYSSIKHLVIDNSVYFDVFDNLLTYIPQLRILTLQCLDGAFCKRLELSPIIFNHLTHVSIKFHMIYFIQFEKLIKDSFHQIQVLRISAGRDITYLDANLWEQLILFHMLNLRVFEINYEGSIHCDKLSCDVLTNNFKSSFWNERKNFFTYQQNWRGNISIRIFYSIDPSRKTNYRLFKIKDTTSCPFQPKIISNLVDHIHICSIKALNNCENYFSNVTNLTFDHNFDTPYHSFTSNLNRVIPLLKITKLIIQCYNIQFTELIEILRFTPNVHTLKYPSIGVRDTEYTSIQQTDSFIFVSNSNNIKTASFNAKYGLETAKFLLNLFPRLTYLKIVIDRKQVNQFLQILLSRNNNNNSKLFFICFSRVPKLCIREIKRLFKSEKLLDDYLIKYINRNLYIWW